MRNVLLITICLILSSNLFALDIGHPFSYQEDGTVRMDYQVDLYSMNNISKVCKNLGLLTNRGGKPLNGLTISCYPYTLPLPGAFSYELETIEGTNMVRVTLLGGAHSTTRVFLGIHDSSFRPSSMIFRSHLEKNINLTIKRTIKKIDEYKVLYSKEEKEHLVWITYDTVRFFDFSTTETLCITTRYKYKSFHRSRPIIENSDIVEYRSGLNIKCNN